MKNNCIKVLCLIFVVSLIAGCSASSNGTPSTQTSEGNSATPAGIDWDEVEAIDSWDQESVLLTPRQVESYSSFDQISTTDSNSSAITPEESKSGFDFITPQECSPSWGFLFNGLLNKVEKSEFSNSLGSGWEKLYSDFEAAKALSFRVVTDLAKSKKPLISLLHDEVNACPYVRYVQTGDPRIIWEISFRSKQDSDDRLTVAYDIKNSEKFKGSCVTKIHQVGRNLISSDLCHWAWQGGQYEPISKKAEEQLVDTTNVISKKIRGLE